MPATIKDVAKMAGVSAATVSRVINNDPRISQKTAVKVRECIKKLDYKMNSIARSLKTNKSFTVGFIAPEIPNDFFMSIAKGAEDECSKHGYNIIICNSNENSIQEADRIKLLFEKHVDGIIIIPASSERFEMHGRIPGDMPVVLVDRLISRLECDAVLADNINGSYEALSYLINKGHRRIGFIGGDTRLTSFNERYEGYMRAMRDYCIPLEEEIIKFGDFHVEGGYKLMKELMGIPNPPSYVFISNFYMHVGATKYLVETVGRSKNAVSIAGFDDMELSSVLGFCSVRVAQPMLEMGRSAAQILLERINGGKGNFPKILRLKTRLITENIT